MGDFPIPPSTLQISHIPLFGPFPPSIAFQISNSPLVCCMLLGAVANRPGCFRRVIPISPCDALLSISPQELSSQRYSWRPGRRPLRISIGVVSIAHTLHCSATI
jgi:hypothetical protein